MIEPIEIIITVWAKDICEIDFLPANLSKHTPAVIIRIDFKITVITFRSFRTVIACGKGALFTTRRENKRLCLLITQNLRVTCKVQLK